MEQWQNNSEAARAVWADIFEMCTSMYGTMALKFQFNSTALESAQDHYGQIYYKKLFPILEKHNPLYHGDFPPGDVHYSYVFSKKFSGTGDVVHEIHATIPYLYGDHDELLEGDDLNTVLKEELMSAGGLHSIDTKFVSPGLFDFFWLEKPKLIS